MQELKKLFHQIDQTLHTYKHPGHLKQKKAQLEGVEQTIAKLNRKEVQIPADLRQLKLSLLKEMEDCQDAKKVTKELLALCRKFIDEHKLKRQSKNNEDQLTLFANEKNSNHETEGRR